MRAKYLRLFIVFIAIYVLFTLLPAPTQQVLAQYHLSPMRARLISTTVVLPVIGIWLVALYGFITLKEYAVLIKNTKDGAAMNTISKGILWLALGPPLAAAASAVTSYLVKQHSTWLASTTIINNYISLLTMAIGLYFVSEGAEQLVALVRKKPSKREQNILVLIFITLSALYAHLIVSQPIHSNMGTKVYYMANILVILTIAIPYLYIWYRGLLGAYYIYHYQKQVQGHIYKRGLLFLASGISVVVLTSIFIRLLVTISARITTLNLTPVLLIIYGFLILSACGYVLIALGAKKLRKIEEV